MWRRLLLICTTVFLFSCVTRKVAVSTSQVKTNTDSVAVEKKDSVAVQQNAISIKEDIDEIEVVPIDTTKPITIGDKQYFNATVRIKKTKRAVIDTSKTTVSKIEDKRVEVKKKQNTETFVKNVDKKPSYFNLWWLLLIPVAIWLIRRYILK